MTRRVRRASDDLWGEIDLEKIAGEWIGRCFKQCVSTEDQQVTRYYRINYFNVWYYGLLVEYHSNGEINIYPKAFIHPFWVTDHAQNLPPSDFVDELNSILKRELKE